MPPQIVIHFNRAFDNQDLSPLGKLELYFSRQAGLCAQFKRIARFGDGEFLPGLQRRQGKPRPIIQASLGWGTQLVQATSIWAYQARDIICSAHTRWRY